MKAISVHVEEDNYRTFQRLAAREGKPVAELLREAMADYLQRKLPTGRRLTEIPARKGRQIVEGWTRSEVFDEMIDG
jgi:hypothetical protein